eukprot:CAMPEP_0196658006 /NCGR_PEP_ID=MMETSP1086-20130531/26589_1 /TAXON_ID=77921 /ORGANISM="Cyanoptyche  gloeocystis , Strain SAG4.97" /LENGTH=45 /DNA_ID= /DNA_START= /DNA_END= /DNA_ORIENTATION=
MSEMQTQCGGNKEGAQGNFLQRSGGYKSKGEMYMSAVYSRNAAAM